jgi:hypothetical protein
MLATIDNGIAIDERRVPQRIALHGAHNNRSDAG